MCHGLYSLCGYVFTLFTHIIHANNTCSKQVWVTSCSWLNRVQVLGPLALQNILSKDYIILPIKFTAFEAWSNHENFSGLVNANKALRVHHIQLLIIGK